MQQNLRRIRRSYQDKTEAVQAAVARVDICADNAATAAGRCPEAATARKLSDARYATVQAERASYNQLPGKETELERLQLPARAVRQQLPDAARKEGGL
ncbi:MAG: hypothetical protein WKG07_07160 [Hymenobacter sp.]